MNGLLFTQDFLLKGIQTTPVWVALSEATVDEFTAGLRRVYAPHKSDSVLNEAMTESEIILKVLALLDWSDLALPQVTASGSRREDVPDMLLLSDAKAKQLALKEKKEDRRYRHGIAILEAKRWMRPLDRGDATNRLDPGTPSNQILRYLSAVEGASDRAVRWGMLTNGRLWRLYYQGARSRSEEFLEIDLAALIGVPGIQGDIFDSGDSSHGIKIFLCMFQRVAFLTQTWDAERRTFHEYALAEARQYEEKVSQDLGGRVFGTVFPDLANALAGGDPEAPSPLTRAYLDDVRDAALILLYRLLFVLYAEDRALLPIRDKRYFDYSLRRIREEVRDKRDKGAAFSTTAARTWDDLRNLFSAIAQGDSALGLPAYNGGLFDNDQTPVLARTKIPDAQLAPVIDELSRRSDLLRAWINYRDLSVQHLGSIYERLLEYRLDPDGERIVPRPTSFARKDTGSYYTHDDLVKLLIKETVGPLVEERVAAFDARIKIWKRKKELNPADWRNLDGLDPASRILDLRICDPAMGSGHFLVSLVDYLADQVLEAMSHGAESVLEQPWAWEAANLWVSPLIARIADIRDRILASAKEHDWTVAPEQLDDRHIVRRMILKRVIHGVDKNPMAVELAKVALWLHTFTVGAPLSFLDHHLRCGDALHGERLEAIREDLTKFGVLFQSAELERLALASKHMSEIADLTDIDIAEAHHSKDLLDTIDTELAPLVALQDFWRSLRWLEPRWPDTKIFKSKSPTKRQLALAELLSGRYNLVGAIAAGRIKGSGGGVGAANALLDEVKALTTREHFLHWPSAFPSAWADANPAARGFDAVIGNPPWDRIKLQEVEWFAERQPEIARATRAADRKRMIVALQKCGDPLWNDYQEAQAAAETAARVARDCGDYPLLAGGDINLYSLFVERAQSLVHARGIVGLLTPSGIAADKGAAKFFSSISTSGRLAVLYDFENKKVFFPDIHASFKFCALVFGGEARTFEASRCAFYLHAISDLDDADRVLVLAAEDFTTVNPNTGAAPIFRSRRDAEITTAIYRRQPVLVDRRPEKENAPPKKVWPVRYVTMFHMTNDSKLFMRRDELEKQGWYPTGENHWKKGDAEAVPLYEGKMVQLYDHRAADVVLHSDNLYRAAQQESLTDVDHHDPARVPQPQFFVSRTDVDQQLEGGWVIAFKDVTASTNVRTMIAAIVPHAGYGNTLPVLLADVLKDAPTFGPLLVANLNSMPLDYLARQKVQGQHLNWYIVEQLSMIRPQQFEAKIGKTKIADFIRGEVLRLSYTAHDLAPFARDLGYDGPPFKWDEDDRRHRMARLDALFFQLYGIGREDAAYILDTFPIVREQDEKAFDRYLTKDLVLAYMNAVAAGDLKTTVSV